MQNYAAYELHVKGNHVPGQRMSADLLGGADKLAAGIFDERIRLGQDIIERFTLGDTILEFLRFARKILIREIFGLILLLNPVDFPDNRPELF
jgi:hypothetical protein